MASPLDEDQSPPVSLDAFDDTPSTLVNTPSSAAASHSNSSSAGDAVKLNARRGKITQIACVPCRQRKSKCDGTRPVCQACQTRPNVHCVYDVTLDQRKPSSLRQRVGELEQEVTNFKDILELLLQALPDRLRPRFLGFVQHVNEGGLSAGLLDEARRRLCLPTTPDDTFRHIQQTIYPSGDREKKSVSATGCSNPAIASSQHASETTNPYFSNLSSDSPGRTGADNPMFDNPPDGGLVPQMHDSQTASSSPFWRMQGVKIPDWNDPSSDLLFNNSDAATRDLSKFADQTASWRATNDRSTRTLHLYGKIENVESAGQNSVVELDTMVPQHVVQPLNEDDPQPLSGMYSGVFIAYRDAKRQLIRGGSNMDDIFGGPMLNFQAAVQSTQFHNDLPLSTWAPALFGNHRNLRPSDRVACAWMVTLLMKWQISPTRDNYEQMPRWLRPTPKQCFIPHAANIDYLPWPPVRDVLMDTNQEGPDITVNTVSVNWPYSDSDVLQVAGNNHYFTLSPAFEAHISSLNNWSLAASIIDAVPALQGLAPADPSR